MIDEKYYVSQKGCKYILSPKRGKWTTINPEFASTLTAVGQSNWIGSFISDNIDHIERGSKTRDTTKVIMKNGDSYYVE